MHPEIVRSGPGFCPICGMALEPMTVSADEEVDPELEDMGAASGYRDSSRAAMGRFAHRRRYVYRRTRRVFQQQFGNGGIGYAYAGRPFLGYRILGSKQAQSTGWKTSGNKFQQLGDGQLGMGGIAISTEHAGDWVTLDATCASLDLQYLKQPGGGGLQFTDNGGQPVSIDTSAEATGPGTFHYNCPAGDHHFELMTLDRSPVTLLGWVATQPGVTWESIGINGAEAPLLLRWDQKLFSSYLQDNAPALIVLAYGTNESCHNASSDPRDAITSIF